ncbi:ADP-ribosylglycohydrolase family protein [Pseudomonas gingeri]|uniref:ADP-ribosylglycohydrolase family protein n=1 Tax=Pseudomonas gingeri TaxID=117681 RepID=UPI0015BEC17E|nr:ADP-ribosylglycohydrolase family protein [Pseudomonas gingeri]NWE72772.1 ADP-ribosylglycohydrolase family protein [Pseudomonas gingeri]
MRLNIENSIVNSALWAAAGDALGWISELTDRRGLVRRIGGSELRSPVAWKRKIGGMSGPQAALPAGTYSDDTQLRLAVCRSIQGDGTFDVEAFAKIELSVWPSYALGAGRGSKAAASNVAKRDINWFSNFFSSTDGPSYVSSGGNGAAMRIQPHVWQRAKSNQRDYLLDVIKDSLTTHGHMRGLCGAIFHADCLAYTISHGEIPGPSEWLNFTERFSEIVDIIKTDHQLGRFWIGAWEKESGDSLINSIERVKSELTQDIAKLSDFPTNIKNSYFTALELLDCLGDRKGTGTNTALAAAYLAWIAQDISLEDALLIAANTLGSDTDTIATMTGALLGVIAIAPPSWPIQDIEYIKMQAQRMAKIATHQSCDSFMYPDLLSWQPPLSQSDSIGIYEGKKALTGLGLITAFDQTWTSGDFIWQWYELDFGQTILCKSRSKSLKQLNSNSIASKTKNKENDLNYAPINKKIYQEAQKPYNFESSEDNETFSLRAENPPIRKELKNNILPEHPENKAQQPNNRSLDEITNIAIRSNFNEEVIGACLLESINGDNGIEKAMAFSAIIAKALLARRNRG